MKRYDPAVHNLFGRDDRFALVLDGQYEGDRIVRSGADAATPDARLKVTLSKQIVLLQRLRGS